MDIEGDTQVSKWLPHPNRDHLPTRRIKSTILQFEWPIELDYHLVMTNITIEHGHL